MIELSVTVHVGLRTCCADRRLNWASEQKSYRRRRFSWIFARYCERVNSNNFLPWSITLYPKEKRGLSGLPCHFCRISQSG